MKCNNCESDFPSGHEGLVLRAAGVPVAGVCGGCVSGVKKAKLVITLQDGKFAYDQFSALEMEKKAFEKTA